MNRTGGSDGSRFRLGIVTSHAVQYKAPLYRRLAVEPWLDLEVLYCHDYGIRAQWSGWGVADFKWDRDLESGYRWRLLRNVSPRPAVSSLFGEVNPELVEILWGKRYDAVLLEGWHTITSAAGMLLGRVSPTPVVLMSEATLMTAPRSPLRKLLKPAATRLLLGSAAAFLALGAQNRAFYRHHGVPEARIFPFPYTVDVAYFTAEAARLAGERARLRADLGFSERDTVFLFVGQMVARKDPLGLLAAYRAVVADGTAAGLVLIGSGPQLEEVRAAAAGLAGVRVVGFKNQSELPPYYALADAFVLPSLEETWGLVVNEAMCFGLPVITTWSMGCTYDLVDGRGTGVAVERGRVTELAGAMRRLAGDAGERRAMGERARAVIGRWTYEEDAAGLQQAARALRR